VSTADRPPPYRDPAVQPERTDLAWQRTGLAFVVVVLLAWRDAASIGRPFAVYGAALLVTLSWGAFLLVTRRRTTLLNTPRPDAVSGGTVLLTGGAVLTAVAAALTMVLLNR
jgi:uncharacterized membrane protein YidH (DUF202 family)